jgi:hypothetical protein
MEFDRTEYMVDGTSRVAIGSDEFRTCELSVVEQSKTVFQIGRNLRKNLRFLPSPMVEVGGTVSRVKMNAKKRRP